MNPFPAVQICDNCAGRPHCIIHALSAIKSSRAIHFNKRHNFVNGWMAKSILENNTKHFKIVKYHLAPLSSIGGPPKDTARANTSRIQPGVNPGFQNLG